MEPPPDEGPPLSLLLDALSMDRPERPLTRGAMTPDEARAVLFSRVREGPMSVRESASAIMLAGRVGALDNGDDLEALLSDASLDPSSRAWIWCVLQGSANDRLQRAQSKMTPDDLRAVNDEKLAIELCLQLPDPNIPPQFAQLLLRVPHVERGTVLARIELSRRKAGFPAVLLWSICLAQPGLASLHDQMATWIIDEGGEGAQLAVELFADGVSDELRAGYTKVMAGLASRAIHGVPGAVPEGSVRRVRFPDGRTQLALAVRTPGGAHVVAVLSHHADGTVEIHDHGVMPLDVHMDIRFGTGLITATIDGMDLNGARDALVTWARDLRAAGKPCPWPLLVLIASLDGTLAPDDRGEPRPVASRAN